MNGQRLEGFWKDGHAWCKTKRLKISPTLLIRVNFRFYLHLSDHKKIYPNEHKIQFARKFAIHDHILDHTFWWSRYYFTTVLLWIINFYARCLSNYNKWWIFRFFRSPAPVYGFLAGIRAVSQLLASGSSRRCWGYNGFYSFMWLFMSVS